MRRFDAAFTLGGTVAKFTLSGTAAIEVTGNASANTITGNDASNVLNGLAGSDTLNGGNGNDIFLIAAQAEHASTEVIDGGAGTADRIRFTAATSQTLTLSSHISNVEIVEIATAAGSAAGTAALNINAAALTYGIQMFGNKGANVLSGSAHADTITGGLGSDTLRGGGDNDVFLIAAQAEHGSAEVIDGGTGTADRIRFTSVTAGDTLLLSSHISNVEIAELQAGATALNLDASAAQQGLQLRGNSGVNALTGSAFADTLFGGLGKDVLDGGAGRDTGDFSDKSDAVVVTLTGATAADVTVNGTVQDTVRNVENLIGGSGNDRFTGDGSANDFRGGLGNDFFKGGLGKDVLDGGGGLDTADFSDKSDAVVGDADRLDRCQRHHQGRCAGHGEEHREPDRRRGRRPLHRRRRGQRAGWRLRQRHPEGRARRRHAEGRHWHRHGGLVDSDSGHRADAQRLRQRHDRQPRRHRKDTFTSIENVFGGAGADVLTGNALDNLFQGRSGQGHAGRRRRIGYGRLLDKTDAVVVTLTGATAANVTVNGTIQDTVKNIENLIGGAGADRLFGDGLANDLQGGLGNDG
jgi:Ca2+-binding RTX toxin-like protein